MWINDLPSETDGDDGGRGHPTLGIESIREPVPEHGPGGPSPAVKWSDIAIDVGPLRRDKRVSLVQVFRCGG